MDEEQIHFKVTWKHIDMVPDEDYEGEKKDMVKHALKTTVKAFNNPDNNAEKDIAQEIKKEFDKEYMVTQPGHSSDHFCAAMLALHRRHQLWLTVPL